ncbi:MAG TPA: polyhydroxyalkanoate depolymerase [Burkholderiales bacterium]|jgi:poly(3-hydroxybutyrate) depolymerase|nr:polyhydroxyalkanoate depolymerase [Burkholderiales bacterium]
MLYSLYEAQHMALAPFRLMAEWSRGWFGHPFSPLAHWPLSRRLAASSDLFLRVTERYEKPHWGVADAQLEIAAQKPFCRLIHFRQERRKPHKVLIVAPLSGHHATLLRDTVRSLLPAHDVWITDWIDARMVPLSAGPFHLADYVDYIREWIALLSPELHVISVCQPTVPVLAAVSLMAERREAQPRTMVMMGGPIDARRSPTAVNNLALKKPHSWFEQNLIHRVPGKYPGYMRLVYPGFLQHLGFVAMNPDRHFNAHWDYFNHLMVGDGESAEAHRRFYNEYNAVLDMPAEYYLDTVKTVFQEFALPKGRMFMRGQLVRPQAIREAALLTVEGELDDISGNGQTEAAHALCLNIPRERRAHFVAPGVGHYGIFSGRRWREVVFPRVRDFISRHAQSSYAEAS